MVLCRSRKYCKQWGDALRSASVPYVIERGGSSPFGPRGLRGVIDTMSAIHRGDPIEMSADEGIRPDSTAEALARLRPAFGADGTVTAGNASQISDGAAALVVADRAAAEAAGLPILAEVVSYGQVGGPDATLHERPAEALQIALQKAGMTVSDLDLVEINEAFAAVALWSARMLDLPHDKVNAHGGGNGAYCYDSKREWIYVVKADRKPPRTNHLSICDILANKWITPKTEGDAGVGMESNQAFFTYDSANDVAAFHIHGKHHVYDPAAKKWAVLPDTAPAATKQRGSRWCSGFYDEQLNAHFYFNAGDSSTRPGDMWVWRYRREKHP